MASFTEQAILKLIDQTSRPADKANAALKRLFATANKLDRKNVNIRVRTTGAQNAAQQLQALVRASGQQYVVRVDSSQIQRALRQANALRAAMGGMPGSRPNPMAPAGGSGGGGRTPNNMFAWRNQDNNWQAAGRIIARSFVAVAGVELATVMRRALGTAGAGVIDIDRARRVADASGVNVNALEEASLEAAGKTKGVSAAEIMSASTEQAAALGIQLKRGEVTQQQYNERLKALTLRAAETAQILGSARDVFKGGAEDARQVEKAVNLTNAGADPEKQKNFTDAILNAAIASGGDVRGDDVKRTLQQYGSAFAASLSPKGIARLALIRDEGGKQSTAEMRQLGQDLIRGSLKAADKELQTKAGLRDKEGRTTLSKKDLEDPVNLVVERLKPLAKAAGVDLDDTIALQDYFDNVVGLSTSGAKAAARITQASEQYQRELEKFESTDARKLLNPTVAAQIAEGKASYQDAVGQATKRYMDYINKLIGLPGDFFTSLSQGKLPGGIAAPAGVQAAAGGALALGAVAGPALADLFTPLNTSATALTGSAGALTLAAQRLGAAGSLPGGAGAGAAGAAGAAGGFLARIRAGLGLGLAAYLTSELEDAANKNVRPVADRIVDAIAEKVGVAKPKETEESKLRREAMEKGGITGLYEQTVLTYQSIRDLITGERKSQSAASEAGRREEGAVPGAFDTARIAAEKELAGLVAERAAKVSDIARLQQEIAKAEARSKETGLFDPNAERKKGELGQAQTEVMSLNERIAKFEEGQKQLQAQTRAAFEEGSSAARANIAAGLAEGGTQLGSTAGDALVSRGGTLGAIIANAIAERVSNLQVTATIANQPNVGTNQTRE
ncbi:hypothetical protein ACWIEX_06015 [Bosea sp. NPDC055353]